MRAKFGQGPTVVSKKGYRQTHTQKDPAALYSRRLTTARGTRLHLTSKHGEPWEAVMKGILLSNRQTDNERLQLI